MQRESPTGTSGRFTVLRSPGCSFRLGQRRLDDLRDQRRCVLALAEGAPRQRLRQLSAEIQRERDLAPTAGGRRRLAGHDDLGDLLWTKSTGLPFRELELLRGGRLLHGGVSCSCR